MVAGHGSSFSGNSTLLEDTTSLCITAGGCVIVTVTVTVTVTYSSYTSHPVATMQTYLFYVSDTN